MPVVEITGINKEDITQFDLKILRSFLKQTVADIPDLQIKRHWITVHFIKTIRSLREDYEDITVFVKGLRPMSEGGIERTRELQLRIATVIKEALKIQFPDRKIEVFVEIFHGDMVDHNPE